MFREIHEYAVASDSICSADPFQHVISNCVQLLNRYRARHIIYVLTCLCPDEFAVVLDLVRLDLSQPHQHKPLPAKNIHIASDSCENLLSHLRARTNMVPRKDYGHFWLELTRHWLLTCPLDPDFDRNDAASEDLFCQKLRSELVERILNIT